MQISESKYYLSRLADARPRSTPVLVRVTNAMMKYHDQNRVGEETVNLVYASTL